MLEFPNVPNHLYCVILHPWLSFFPRWFWRRQHGCERRRHRTGQEGRERQGPPQKGRSSRARAWCPTIFNLPKNGESLNAWWDLFIVLTLAIGILIIMVGKHAIENSGHVWQSADRSCKSSWTSWVMMEILQTCSKRFSASQTAPQIFTAITQPKCNGFQI